MIGVIAHFFHIEVMRVHTIILVLIFLTQAASAQAMERPYRVSLIGDGFDGTQWHTGVLIELDDGWKTYWRMPGEAGIPPDFTWKTSEPADVSVLFPVPARYHDASGETVGYQHEVVFPVQVNAGQATEVKLDLSLFFAVCKDVCIPAKATASVALGTAVRDPRGTVLVEQALASVPKAGNLITSARIVVEDNAPVLLLSLAARPDDIFVETTTSAYFRAPQFSADGREARLVIDNVKDAAKLRGTTLKLTLRQYDRGLEQSVTLP